MDHLVGIVSRRKDDDEDSGDNEHEASMEELMMMKLAPIWSGFNGSLGWFSVDELADLVWLGNPASLGCIGRPEG